MEVGNTLGFEALLLIFAERGHEGSGLVCGLDEKISGRWQEWRRQCIYEKAYWMTQQLELADISGGGSAAWLVRSIIGLAGSLAWQLIWV